MYLHFSYDKKYTAITSLKSTNRLAFVIENQCVYCEVGSYILLDLFRSLQRKVNGGLLSQNVSKNLRPNVNYRFFTEHPG